ncbi:TPA: hypothetical protein R1765_001973 [Campylobacter coli]|nr:hypothetical protein [Campylobacter coli]
MKTLNFILLIASLIFMSGVSIVLGLCIDQFSTSPYKYYALAFMTFLIANSIFNIVVLYYKKNLK